jgi:hypothetical protein
VGRKNREIRISVRSGASVGAGVECPPLKVLVVSGGTRPMLWLGGAKEYDGRAWVSGRDTLRRLRDALTEMLAEAPREGEEVRRG